MIRQVYVPRYTLCVGPAVSLQKGKSMPFSDRVYDPETLRLMTQVLDDTWQAVLSKSVYRALDPTRTRREMAALIMQAVDGGVRNPDDLKRIAMHAIEGSS
jgi:hypothetical protein